MVVREKSRKEKGMFSSSGLAPPGAQGLLYESLANAWLGVDSYASIRRMLER